MEYINLEQRLSKIKKLKNLQDYEISGVNGNIQFYKNKHEIGNIIYSNDETIKIQQFNLKNQEYLAPLILFIESITHSQDKDIFFKLKTNNNSTNYNKFETYLKSIKYEKEEFENELGLYLDLTEFESYNQRLNDLKKIKEFQNFIK